MSLADQIFPAERQPDFVQTEWSRGWGLQSIGFGEAAGLLIEQRALFQGSIDPVGLAMFYFQRHRVALARQLPELPVNRIFVRVGGPNSVFEVSAMTSVAALWRPHLRVGGFHVPL